MAVKRRPGRGVPLGAFELYEQVGRGGMGEVWYGEHRENRLPVAVKVVRPRRGGRVVNVTAFENEVGTSARLDHPHIVMVLDYGRVSRQAERRSRGELQAGSPYLVMEWADEGTLGSRRGFVNSWEELHGVLKALLLALAHAHAHGVVHRDLKPGNVLICGKRATRPGLKLADFGLARAADQVTQDGTRPAGTPLYMPPEQGMVRSRDQGPWSDLYSLGCVAYKLTTGAVPFRGETAEQVAAAHQHDPVPPVMPMFAVPPGFDAWIGGLMAKAPEDRYPLAADALEALNDLKMGQAPVRSLLPADRRVPELPRSWRSTAMPVQHRQLQDVGLGIMGLRQPPMVGRVMERDALWAALARVQSSGQASMVLLQGPMGCGKSRLAEWICQRANEVGGARALRATHTREEGATDGLGPMLARHFGCVGLSRAAVRDRVSSVMGSQGVDDPTELESLTALLSWSASDANELGDMGGTGQSHTVFRRLLKRVASDRPVIMRLDDIQWGSASLEFAAALLDGQAIDPVPVLIVGTVQDDGLVESPSVALVLKRLERHNRVLHLRIGALPPDQHGALIRNLLGLAPKVADDLLRRTAGNPLLTVETLRDWVQQGVLVAGPRGFELTEDALVVPQDIQAAWQVRLERILGGRSDEEVAGIELAALLGLDVDAEALAVACRIEGIEVPRALIDALLRRGLLLYPDGGGDGWSFAHGALRQVIEKRAEAAGRIERHYVACARMLAERGGPRSAERQGRYLLRGGEKLAALHPLALGAEARLGVGQLRVALRLLRDRENAMEEMGLPHNDVRWGNGHLLMARTLAAQGETAAAMKRLSEAERQARIHRWDALLPRIRLELGRLCDLTGEGPRSWALLADAESAARESRDRNLHAHVRAAMGWALVRRGELARALACFDRALDQFEADGDDLGAADTLVGLAEVSRQGGSTRQPIKMLRQAIHHFRVCGARWGVAQCKLMLGHLARMSDLDGAESRYREARAQFVSTGHAIAIEVEAHLGLVLAAGEDFEVARKRLKVAGSGLSTQRWRMHLHLVVAGLAICDAGEERWPELEKRLAWLEEEIAATHHASMDLAWALEIADNLADLAEARVLARRARALALGQWRGIKRLTEVERLESDLESSGPESLADSSLSIDGDGPVVSPVSRTVEPAGEPSR